MALRVYPCFIAPADQIVSKTYTTRIEGENTRLRHYLAGVAPQDVILFQVCENAEIQEFDCYFTT